MKKSRFSEQQIGFILRQAWEGMVVEGGVSEGRYQRRQLPARLAVTLPTLISTAPVSTRQSTLESSVP